MSWFDTSGLASLAKSALKEAQKTLDKALDIKDDVDNSDEHSQRGGGDSNDTTKSAVTEKNDMNEASIWGSFTGSYFDANKIKHLSPDVSNGISNATAQATLATPEPELTPVDDTTGFPSKYTATLNLGQESSNESHKKDAEEADLIGNDRSSVPNSALEDGNQLEEKVCRRSKPRRNSSNRNSFASNRLSVVSNDSEGRKSSESVEVVGSSFSGTPTSPESELPSISVSSSMGLPLNSPSYSESVEIIDSLASPSSVEVIPSESTEELEPARNHFVTSPGYSTDSVEVIEDLEEEDSYASLSESTGTTMFSHIPPMTDSCQDLSQASSRVLSGDSTPDVMRLMLTSHGSCDLLSDSIQEVDWESPLMRASTCSESGPSRPHSSHGSPVRRLLSRSEDRIAVGNGGKFEMKNIMEDSQQSGSSTAIDSSCEGTLIGSSSDEGTTVLVVEDRGSYSQSASPPCYMKDLLAEAMGEDSYTRTTSPTLSEKSKSDMVKVGSEQTSGHTSGDELETATSSDIEVISRCSPNGGDSSSTASRHSPAKLLSNAARPKLSVYSSDASAKDSLKRKGHQREPSEASSACSEDISCSETDKLSKKIMELTEILEAREGKLVELSRSNLELQEKNMVLKKQLESTSKPSSDALLEKDVIILELREEGEKLSKIQLKQNNLIKTLRKQEQTNQTIIANNKKQLESLSQELETTKKKLVAKEELEKSQIEKVALLTAKVGRQDEETANLLDQLERAVIKAEQLRINLNLTEQEAAAKTKAVQSLERELQELKQASQAAIKDRERLASVEKTAQASRDILHSQIDELRLQLKHVEQLHSKREAHTREEKKNMLRRLEEAESRNEELAQSVSVSTRPLLRQLEVLQNSTTQQRESWERRERELLNKIEEEESIVRGLKEVEKGLKLELIGLRGKDSGLASELAATRLEMEREKAAKNDLQVTLSLLQEDMERSKQKYEETLEGLRNELADSKRNLAAVEIALATQREALQEGVKGGERSPPPSPTLSFGHGSLTESISSTNWQQFGEEVFETASMSGRYGNVYDSVRVGSSTLLEGLQAQLKMRDGETVQLQWELQRRDTERAALTSELSALSVKVQEQQEALARAEEVSLSLAQLQRNYDALLQMHGEKVEEVEELRLDLQDVKDMYKAQIEQLITKGSNRIEPPG